MNHAENIILADESARRDLVDYEQALPSRTLGEHIYACQSLSENADEAGIAKIFLLHLSREKETAHEVERIIGHSHTSEKADFLGRQLRAGDKDIVEHAIVLIGVLRERQAIPALMGIFSKDDAPRCKLIITALATMPDPIGINLIKRALNAPHKDVVIHAMRALAHMIGEVSWKTFKPFLTNQDKDLRDEAAASIVIRKIPQSARALVQAMMRETDRTTKIKLIQHLGVVPSPEPLRPLLSLLIHDPDHKIKLVASRTLHRILGSLPPHFLFRMRNVRDDAMRAEIVLLLGLYGAEDEALTAFIRKTLVNADDTHIVQSCLQALGYIAEHDDVNLITRYLRKDPMTSYNAALALTRTWRLDDNNKIVDALTTTTSSIIRQVFLKHLIHRRGADIAPHVLLETAKQLRRADTNVNVHYLTSAILEFAPSVETLNYLISLHPTSESEFEQHAIRQSLHNLILNHDDLMLTMIRECTLETCCTIMQFIPPGKDDDFYRALAAAMFGKDPASFAPESLETSCNRVYAILSRTPAALKQFLKVVMGTAWQGIFVNALSIHLSADMLPYIRDELIALTAVDDPHSRSIVIGLLKNLRDPATLPYMMRIAESGTEDESTVMARETIRIFAREGIV